jgi:ribosomal-protein-serine acetyltransferase
MTKDHQIEPTLTALMSDSITLHLINDDNLSTVVEMFQGFPDSAAMIEELYESYVPVYAEGRRTRYGFYAMLDNAGSEELAGMTLLDVDDWQTGTGSTGADIFLHERGKGVAPRTKPHLFYLAFGILGLNRVATGCFVSNVSSKKSIEKTLGFQYEGTMRQSGINDNGECEDEYLYAILRQDWLELYDASCVEARYIH